VKDSPHMGLKRWILAIFVPVVVIGLLVVLSFQMGADERIIRNVIPKVEKRFGVRFEYRDVSVGLTSVVFDGVKVASAAGGALFARLERLGVNVRVGPLLFGKVDLTGLRCEKLELLFGEGIGASAAQWRALVDAIRARSAGTGGEGSSAHGELEVHVVSGSVRAAVEGFALSIGDISGRLSDNGEAVLRVEEATVSHGSDALVVAGGGELRYKPEGKRASIVLEQPRFEIPMGGQQLLAIARDARRGLTAIGIDIGDLAGSSVPQEGKAPPEIRASSTVEPLSIRFLVTEGAASLIPSSGERVALEKISAELVVSHRELMTGRATGSFPGTDARWVLSGTWPNGRPLHFDVEVPDLPLRVVGPLFGGSSNLDFGRAFADGVLALDFTQSGLELAGQASVSGLGVKNPRLDDETVADLAASLDFKAIYDRAAAEIRIERALMSRGQARATIRGVVHLDRLAFDLTTNIPATACRQMLAAVPIELRREVDGAQLSGTFGLDLHVALDIEKPTATVLEATLDNLCRIEDFGPLPYPDDFRRPFSYTAYAADGSPLRLVTGPGNDRWATFATISPYVVEAVLTTEDGKFMNHEGLTLPEIRRAIELNLLKKELSHGASTITMQLAKNLFLSRTRTVSRKLEELFFTWYLETYFSKDEILELYLNVVEFGPSIYGIRDAAHEYFGREPYELDLAESVFLIKLLPSPVSRYEVYAQGEVSERRMGALHKVMQTMLDRGRISQAEYREGLAEKIDFYREGEPLPEPRPRILRSELEPLPDGDFETPAEEEESAEKADWGY
jgi:hypothetical protein